MRHFFCLIGLSSLPTNLLPSNITEEWFETLPLLEEPAENSALYSGAGLLNSVKQVKLHIDSENPLEEFRVSIQSH